MSEVDRPPHPERPILVELVGAAGTGKSTLYHMLLEVPGVAPPPVLRRTEGHLVVARPACRAALLLARSRAVAPLDGLFDRLRAMAYLEVWPNYLVSSEDARVCVFDQGPLFYLTRSPLLNPRLAPWWERTFARWAELLDVVVMLDAPVDVLTERINHRSKAHALKGVASGVAAAELAQARAVLGDAIARLARVDRPPRILQIDTSRRSSEQVRDDVLASLPAG